MEILSSEAARETKEALRQSPVAIYRVEPGNYLGIKGCGITKMGKTFFVMEGEEEPSSKTLSQARIFDNPKIVDGALSAPHKVYLDPTAGNDINLKPLVVYMPNAADKLLSVKTIDQIVEFPISLREKLILKCGAGTGQYYSDSKGVFRLGGSKSFVKKIIDFVMERVVKLREPWIIQVYVDSKYEIPLSLPDNLIEQHIVNAHARFMVYGGRFGKRKPVIIGGLGNFGKHWKVTGKAPKKDEFGNLLGTAFNDMRVAMKN